MTLRGLEWRNIVTRDSDKLAMLDLMQANKGVIIRLIDLNSFAIEHEETVNLY